MTTNTHNVSEGWQDILLKDTASYFIDGDWIESEYISEEGIRIIQTGNIGIGEYLDKADNARYINLDSFRKLNCKKVYPGDLLICRLADPIGRSCLVSNTSDYFVTAVDVAIYRPKKEFCKEFVLYLLNSKNKLKEMADYAGGSTRQRISRTNLGNLNLSIPKVYLEQRKIAEILIMIDEAIKNTETLIDKYKSIKQGLMQDLFRYGIDEKGQIRSEKTHKFKNSPLGRIPEEWEIFTFKDLLSQIIDFRGKTPKKIGMDWGGGNIPALSANNVEMGRINFEKETYYGSEKLYKKWMNKGHCSKGDVVMTMEAPLGNVAQISDDNKYILSQRVVLFKANDFIDINYFKHCLVSDMFRKALFIDSTGTTATGIQQKKLLKIMLSIPTNREEQIRIADLLYQSDNVIDTESIYKNKLMSLKRGLMEDLLFGKVRVNKLLN